MCGGKPSMPAVQPVRQPEIAAPTYADAKVSKAAATQRNRTSGLAGRNIKTSARGLNDEATTEKKDVLGA